MLASGRVKLDLFFPPNDIWCEEPQSQPFFDSNGDVHPFFHASSSSNWFTTILIKVDV